ncbi:MAG: pilus assembly protein PilM [Candidatus Sumerlaeia bacterium]
MLVIEFQDTFCRIFHWQQAKGGYILRGHIVAPLERNALTRPDETEIAERNVAQINGNTIRQALKKAGIRDSEAIAVVPKQWVTLRIVTLPSGDPNELPEMARFEAERHIPFNVERHIISHCILTSEEIQGSQVLIAAMDGPPAQDLTDTMAAAGIRLLSLEVSTTALANALMHSGEWDAEQNQTVAQINIGFGATDITILCDGQPVFARSVSLGVDKLLDKMGMENTLAQGDVPESQLASLDLLAELPEPAEAPAFDLVGADEQDQAEGSAEKSEQHEALENWRNRLIQEVRRTYDFAQREFQCQPFSQVFLSGVGSNLGNVEAFLEKRLGMRPTVLNAFIGGLRIDEKSESIHLRPAAYCIGAGAILREIDPKALQINLLPQEYLRRESLSRKRQSLMITLSLAVALVVCGFLYAHQTLRAKRLELRTLEKNLEVNEERVEEVQYREGVVRILSAHTDPEGSAMGILDDMSKWADLFGPGNMRVSIIEFNYTAGRNVKIIGHATSHKDLNDFLLKLEQSGHFESVRKESTPLDNKVYPGGKRLIRYTLNGYFKEKR